MTEKESHTNQKEYQPLEWASSMVDMEVTMITAKFELIW